MTITAQFVRQSEDGTVTYRVTLVDAEHLSEPIDVEALIFEGDIFLCEPITDEQEYQEYLDTRKYMEHHYIGGE
jgi:hypothetical protein